MIKYVFFAWFLLMSVVHAKEVDYVQLVHKITSEFVRTIGKEKQIFLTGSGGGMMHDVEAISLSFTCFHKFDVDQARQFYVDVMESYLKLINENEKIRPYLHNYPFDFHNLELDIGFEDEKTHKWKKDSVAFVFHNEKGNIFYDMYDHENQKLVKVHKETYTDALQIVKQAGNKNSKSKAVMETKESLQKSST